MVAGTSIRHPNDNLGQDIEVDDEDIVNIVQTFYQPLLILDVLRLEITCHCHPCLEIHFFDGSKLLLLVSKTKFVVAKLYVHFLRNENILML